MWQALELVSPTDAGGFHLSGIGDSILNSSGLKFSHIWFSPSSFLAHLIIHHEVLDHRSIKRFWILSLLGPLLVSATCEAAAAF